MRAYLRWMSSHVEVLPAAERIRRAPGLFLESCKHWVTQSTGHCTPNLSELASEALLLKHINGSLSLSFSSCSQAVSLEACDILKPRTFSSCH